MDAAASLDALDPLIVRLARLLVVGAKGVTDRAERIQRFARDRIWYTRDPWGIETTPDARHIIEIGTEDCDGKARVFVALVRALHDPDLSARIRSVWKGPHFVHAQAEVRIGDGPWRLVELIVRGLGVGDAPDDHPEVI